MYAEVASVRHNLDTMKAEDDGVAVPVYTDTDPASTAVAAGSQRDQQTGPLRRRALDADPTAQQTSSDFNEPGTATQPQLNSNEFKRPGARANQPPSSRLGKLSLEMKALASQWTSALSVFRPPAAAWDRDNATDAHSPRNAQQSAEAGLQGQPEVLMSSFYSARHRTTPGQAPSQSAASGQAPPFAATGEASKTHVVASCPGVRGADLKATDAMLQTDKPLAADGAVHTSRKAEMEPGCTTTPELQRSAEPRGVGDQESEECGCSKEHSSVQRCARRGRCWLS